MDDAFRAVRLDSLGAAVARLEAALAQPKTEWTRDAAIQRFEFSFELAWKTVKDYLEQALASTEVHEEIYRRLAEAGIEIPVAAPVALRERINPALTRSNSSFAGSQQHRVLRLRRIGQVSSVRKLCDPELVVDPDRQFRLHAAQAGREPVQSGILYCTRHFQRRSIFNALEELGHVL